MASLIVKAAEERSKYIVDVYHYGIKCNKCTYDYEYYAMKDFVSLCYDVDCGDSFTTTSVDKTVNCTSLVELIPEVECVPAARVIDCNQSYTTARTMALEINFYLYNTVVTLGGRLYFTFSSLIVNGVEYLDGPRTFTLHNENVTTKVIEGTTVITNLITWLNSFNLPDITFYVDKANRMKVRYPTGTTFQISTACNTSGDDITYGLRITQAGVTGLEITLGGGYIAPPYKGSGAVWNTVTETLSVEYLC